MNRSFIIKLQSLSEKLQRLETLISVAESDSNQEEEEFIVEVRFHTQRQNSPSVDIGIKDIRPMSYSDLISQIRQYFISKGFDINHREITIVGGLDWQTVNRFNWTKYYLILCYLELDLPVNTVEDAQAGG